MKNKYSGLSTEEQIKRYKKGNKTLLVCAIICSIVVVNLDTETLKEELAVAETDAEELHAYLKFLKENHIIGEPD